MAKKTAKTYRVHCNCPTPLETNPAEVEADDEATAIELFKQANGIAATDHEIVATESGKQPPTGN